MAITSEELESFHRFAMQRVQSGVDDLTMQTLVNEWHVVRERDRTNTAIRQGIADIENGNYRSLDDFMTAFRNEHNIADGE